MFNYNKKSTLFNNSSVERTSVVDPDLLKILEPVVEIDRLNKFKNTYLLLGVSEASIEVTRYGLQSGVLDGSGLGFNIESLETEPVTTSLMLENIISSISGKVSKLLERLTTTFFNKCKQPLRLAGTITSASTKATPLEKFRSVIYSPAMNDIVRVLALIKCVVFIDYLVFKISGKDVVGWAKTFYNEIKSNLVDRWNVGESPIEVWYNDSDNTVSVQTQTKYIHDILQAPKAKTDASVNNGNANGSVLSQIKSTITQTTLNIITFFKKIPELCTTFVKFCMRTDKEAFEKTASAENEKNFIARTHEYIAIFYNIMINVVIKLTRWGIDSLHILFGKLYEVTGSTPTSTLT